MNFGNDTLKIKIIKTKKNGKNIVMVEQFIVVEYINYIN